MKNILLAAAFIMIAFLSACGPTIPTEAEVRAKIVGEYCAENYRLVITDSTYRNRKSNPGLISKTGPVESCKGTYDLVMKDNSWQIHFARDPRPNGIKHCQVSYVLWNMDQEYVIEQEKRTILWDLFDEQALIKGACE